MHVQAYHAERVARGKARIASIVKSLRAETQTHVKTLDEELARESDEITRAASRASESARVQAESLRAKIAAETKRHRAALKDLIRGLATAESENARARKTIEAARVRGRARRCVAAPRSSSVGWRRSRRRAAEVAIDSARISDRGRDHGSDDAPRQHPAEPQR